MSLPSGHSSVYLPEETTSVECCNNIHQIASGEETIDKTIEDEISHGNSVINVEDNFVDMFKKLQVLTLVEMRILLQNVNLSSYGTKKQLRERLKNYYRKEYTSYRKNIQNEFFPKYGNKTAVHFDFLVAMDFECTCSETINDYPHEIIEFPAVLIDVRNMRIVDKFRTFVKPQKNPILDHFCTELTGIPQSAVDNAPMFPEVLRNFKQWMAKHKLGENGHRYAFVTDGPHDLWKFFQFQCILSGFESVPHEFRYFINIKRIFEQRIKKLPRRNGKTGIQNMLGHYNISFEGRTHCGLDDSINIARLCIKLMQDKIELRINQRLTMCQDKSKDHKLDHEMLGSTNTDCYVCHRKLPLKLRQVTRSEFLNGNYLDCDSCDD